MNNPKQFGSIPAAANLSQILNAETERVRNRFNRKITRWQALFAACVDIQDPTIRKRFAHFVRREMQEDFAKVENQHEKIRSHALNILKISYTRALKGEPGKLNSTIVKNRAQWHLTRYSFYDKKTR